MTAVPLHRFRVYIENVDIDFMGHVNNATYLKWVQAAVLDHWRVLAPAETWSRHLWVALKHEITYRKPAFLKDQVVATVVLERVHGVRAYYHTTISRGEEVLAEVKSSWCCLDARTMRPSRLDRDVVESFFSRNDPQTEG